MACNSYANCYIGCSCKTGWNKRSASASSVSDVSNLQTSGVKTASASSLSGNISTMAAGDSCTVNITDPRYGTSCSISSTKDCAGVCDGSAYFRCTSGSTSSYCSSGKYSVYLGKQQCSSGNATNSTSCYTCYTCSYSCPSGYYTSAGSGYYLTSTYKYQVCNGDSSQTNSTKCYTRASCSYSCPSGYATSAGSGYYLTSTYKYQVCNGDSSQTNSTKCYERKACSYSCPDGYSTSTTSSSCGSGYTFKSTSASTQSGCSAKQCGKCEKLCTPSCTNETNCKWGSYSKSDGCGGTCTKCYPACAPGYKYNFGPTDCYVRPYIILTDPSNPNCGKCECNNYNSDCGGKPCDCAII